MAEFSKIFKIGYVLEYTREQPVYVYCKYKNNRLSLSGVIGPKANGDCYGSCGQIQDYLPLIDIFCGEWDDFSRNNLVNIWNEHHLNDMHAGTPEQEKFIKDYLKEYGDKYDYSLVCEILKEAGLYEINGYKYGHGWLFEPVPESVISWLASLPDNSELIPKAWAK